MKLIFNDTTKTRLDQFLRDKIDLSRSKIQQLIEEGLITVNGEKVTKHNWLKAGDEIEYLQKDVKAKAHVNKFEPNDKVKFKVVYEDDDIIIIDKPAGLTVHPTDQMENDTLANGLIAKYPELKKVGENPVRPGIVHRLDKKVSGLLLVARNKKSFEYYKDLFATRQIEKIYTALVHGKMEQPVGDINFPISRSLTHSGRMAAHPEETELDSKEAITHYEVIEQFEHLALLKITIETGRTHQIRVHMQAIQHPIVGDQLYAIKTVKQNIPLDRVFLHASELSFVDQHGVEQKFKSKLPKELEALLSELK